LRVIMCPNSEATPSVTSIAAHDSNTLAVTGKPAIVKMPFFFGRGNDDPIVLFAAGPASGDIGGRLRESVNSSDSKSASFKSVDEADADFGDESDFPGERTSIAPRHLGQATVRPTSAASVTLIRA
ncbi:MAG: hypothetical protein K8T25_24990, partial [Planctomycetia bacterium]|nr:hypothetical protein [Planctomycetia bacterium]